MPYGHDHPADARDQPWGELLPAIADVARPHAAEGEVADYIPALAQADPEAFALAVVPLGGDEAAVGEADTPFAIQSISKVLTLALAVQRFEGTLWDRVGVEPSGDPFNSLVQLEHERGKPRNPLINAGAQVVADVLHGCLDDPVDEIMAFVSELAGEPVAIDEVVRESEMDAQWRNRSMIDLMKAFGNIEGDPDAVLGTYVAHCAISMTARQLARAMGFLANDGVDPSSGRRVLPTEKARRINALMLTCGTYDSAGEFAFEVGIPCKSGVGGGIVGVIPHELSVCAWSPPLGDGGNSVAAKVALRELVQRTGLSVF